MEPEPLRCLNCGKRIPKTRLRPICSCLGVSPTDYQCIHLGEKVGVAKCGCDGEYKVHWCNKLDGHCVPITPGKTWDKVATPTGSIDRVKRLKPCRHCPSRARIVVTDLGQQPSINNCIAVTALSPRKHSLERQIHCLATWKRFGLTIAVKNTQEEIGVIRASFPMVDHWIECDDQTTNYSYPTQKILNLSRTSIELDVPVLLINSDIELYGDQKLLTFDEQSTFVGIRWNYDESMSEATEFQWGLDAFTFTPRQAELLPDDFPYGIGQAMWDYAVPAILLKHEIRLNFVHTPLLFHRNHPQNWSPEGWHFGANWLASRYGVKIEYETPQFRNSLEPNVEYRDGRYQPTAKR